MPPVPSVPKDDDWIVFKPKLSADQLDEYTSFARTLSRHQAHANSVSLPQYTNLELLLSASLTRDLVAMGWKIRVLNGQVLLCPIGGGVAPAKEAVRQAQLAGRDAQLREPAVASFIRSMERRRLTPKGWHSIFSLMRSGRELADRLRPIAAETDTGRRAELVQDIIRPYIQVADPSGFCDETGLPLYDVWRYFRHTWVTEYQTVPGRSLSLLIRDSAAENHPVIGIAALGSAVVQQTARDMALGWTPDQVLEQLKSRATARDATWLLDVADNLIAGIDVGDFISQGILTVSDIVHPTDTICEALLRVAEIAAAKHEQSPHSASTKTSHDKSLPEYWKNLARTHLYRSKRAKLLADFLKIRLTFQRHGMKRGNRSPLFLALKDADFCQAVRRLVLRRKSERVGIDMMDITVCGAVAPYNHLLGGKLVCMLMAGPELASIYEKQYTNYTSIIASGLAGAPVTRRPKLVALSTTSLYGIGSSQYNRVRVPADLLGGMAGAELRYEELSSVSRGFGTFHLSRTTQELVDRVLNKKNVNRVNYIFGEGVSPKLRKMRDGIELVGLPSEEILNHGCSRVVYLVKLATNTSEYLLGRERTPKWIVPRKNEVLKTNLICTHWKKRWLAMRIASPGILDEVGKHTTNYPITHGARVRLPEQGSELGELFDRQ
jgi:hypothetical protein